MTYEQIIKQNKEFIDETFSKIDKKLSKTTVKYKDKIPYSQREDGTFDDYAHCPSMWTNGFWGGLNMLMYEYTKNEDYLQTALTSEKLMDKAFSKVEELNHDVGFMWHVLSGANYKINGDKESRNRNLLVAMLLASRYEADAKYIRCWNGPWRGEDTSRFSIIDCMMNLPLLYWASKELNDDRFYRIAVHHADMAQKYHVRADGSVNHIVIHDLDKPDTVIGTHGGQGYKEGSSWSRGVSWAVYGFALSYLHTGNKEYLETAKKAAQHFILSAESTGWLPLLDFYAPAEPVYYDATAGAITACGLIEIAKAVPDSEKELYLVPAINILKAMNENWCDYSDKNDGILQMGSESYHGGKHKYIIYGDYYFVEAILKLKGSNYLNW